MLLPNSRSAFVPKAGKKVITPYFATKKGAGLSYHQENREQAWGTHGRVEDRG